MEKNIHTHLFTSLVTSRENRLTFLAAGPEFKQPENAAEHDAQEQELRDKIAKDPTVTDEEIQGRLEALQKSKFAFNGSNNADLLDLRTKAQELKDKRAKEKGDLDATKDSIKDGNADFKAIKDGLAESDKTDSKYLEGWSKGKVLVTKSIDAIKNFVDPSRATNAVAQTEAHLAVLEAMRSLDKDGDVFNDRTGDIAASARSVNALSAQVSKDETTDFAKSLKNLDAAKGKVGAVLDTAVTDARKAAADFKDNVWGEIYNIANANLPLKETQDLIRQMIASIKEINKKLNEKIADATGKTPDAKAPDKPADDKADKPKEFTDKERAAIGEAQEGFRLAVKALRDGKSVDEADAILAEKTNIALDKVGDRKAAIKEIIGSGKEFDESAGKPSFHVKFVEKNQDIHIEDMTKKSEKAADKSSETVTEKEKTILQQILDLLKQINEFLEKNGLKAENSVDSITAKLKALDEEKKGLTEKLGKTTDKKERDSLQLQIDNITLKENELNRQLADVRATNKKLSVDLDKSAEGSAITVRQDDKGNIVLSARNGFNNQQFQNQVQYMQGANPYAKRYIQPYTNRSYTITNYYAGRDLFINSNGNNSNNTVNSNNNNGSNRGNFTDNRRFDNRSFDNRVDNRQSFDNRVDARQDNRRFDNRVTNSNNTTTRESGSDGQRAGGGNRAPLASSDEPRPDVLEANRRFRDRNLDNPAPGRERADVAPPPSVSGTGGGRPIRGPVAAPSTAPRRNEPARTNKKAPTPQKAKGTDTVRGNTSRAD